jgi:hypothetical protein
LSNSFDWENFLRSLSEYLNRAYGPSIAPDRRRHAPKDRFSEAKSKNNTLTNDTNGNILQNSTVDVFAQEAEREVQKALANFFSNGSNTTSTAQQPNIGMLSRNSL